jgi:hypothetical protein
MRYYRVARAFTVGGTLTGLPALDSVTLQVNGSNNLTLQANGTFTFAAPLADGQPYSVKLYTASGLNPMTCTLTNGSGTISGANVTNVLVQCTCTDDYCPCLTGDPGVDMLNAAVADGTANGGVPGVMYTQFGGPFRVTARSDCAYRVALIYSGWARFATIVAPGSCSSTTFPVGTLVIQFGTALACCGDCGPYGY